MGWCNRCKSGMLRAMRRRQHRMQQGLCGLLLAGACVSAWADVAKNPYESIVDRNPFALKPIPPPPDPTTNAPPPPIVPPAQVEVTGITTITGDKRALLEIIPGPGKPMIRPPPLGEGERVESVEVV